jgi:hypothetical protein
MIHKGLILFLGAGSFLLGEPMGVCEVMANLPALNGKEISVRGVWRRGDSGESLWAVPWCEKHTMLDGFEYVDAIQTGPLTGFQSAASFYAEHRRLAAAHPGANIFVTIWGVLRAPEHFEIWIDPWNVERPRAFAAKYAAQLAYTHVADFKAVQAPPETPDEIEWRKNSRPRRVQIKAPLR